MSSRIRMSVTIVVLAIGLPTLALAQRNQAERQTPGGLEHATSPVMVDGRVLFLVRGISALPADQRARGVAGNIVSIAADSKISVADLKIEERGNQTDILAGGRLVMGILDADATLEDVDRQILAGVYKKKIADAITAFRTDRSRPVLLSNLMISAGTVVALVVLLYLIVLLFRRLETLIGARYKSKIQGVRIQSVQLVQAEQLWLAVQGVLRMIRSLSLLVTTLAGAEYILSLYPWTRYFSRRSIDLILDPLRSMAFSVLAATPNLLFIAILVLIVRYLIKLARLFFASVENGAVTLLGFDRDWAWPTYKICRLLVIAFAVVVAYPYVPGSGSEAFKGVSIFAGIIFSLGSTSIVANTIAGYALIYRRVFRAGDRVQIGDHLKDVQEIRLQVTHLRTIKNEEVTVPNSVILNSNVINYSTLAKDQGLILHTTVGIGYETPWRQVESMLLMAAERTAGLLRNPPPFVLQKLLGDFCVTYEINAYCDQPHSSHQLYTDLHRNILDVFNEYGVQIMTPAYEMDPEQAKIVPKDKWYEPPASRQDPAGRK